MVYFSRVAIGLKRHPVRAIAETILCFGVAWTVADAIDNAYPALTIDSPGRLGALVVACLLFGVLRSAPLRSISHRIGGSNSRMTVRFGDLFAEPGVRVIPVNEYFDAELGEHVSAATLHGQIISRLYGGDANRFVSDVDPKLPADQAVAVARPDGRTHKYPLGTVVHTKFNGERYLLVALARTDIQTRKAHATVQDMWTALEGLWKAARVHSNGSPIALPLLGSGQSGVGLPPQLLLSTIVTAALAATQRQRIASEIVVVIQEQFFADIDLRALEPLMR